MPARILLITCLLLGFVTPYFSNLNQPFLIAASTSCPLEVSEFQALMVNTTKIGATMSGSMGSMGNTDGNSSMGMSGGPLSENSEQKLVFSFKSKNSSSQQIACFYWESRYFNAEHKLVIKQFKSKKKVEPNKEIVIKEALPLTDKKSLPAEAKLGYRISKIEYDNKSVWEDPHNNDEGFVYISINFEK